MEGVSMGEFPVEEAVDAWDITGDGSWSLSPSRPQSSYNPWNFLSDRGDRSVSCG